MAPIPLKNVVSVSSEDPMHPGRNLLRSESGRKWLCCAGERKRQGEVEIELCKRARITSIEIWNCGSAFIEVLVGNSDSQEYLTLLPQSTLMTVAESRGGRNRTKIVSYRKDKLSAAAMTRKWNRVKIICRQPFNLKDQFGIQSISFYSDSHDPQTPSSHLFTPPHTPKLLLSPPAPHPRPPSGSENVTPGSAKHFVRIPRLTPDPLRKGKSPNSTTVSSQQKSEKKTPKRPLKEQVNIRSEEEDEYEFSGVEKQSRLFRNALRGKPSGSGEHEKNPILEKIISERSKYQKKGSLSLSGSYQRRKLLQKELPKADVQSDFAASYEQGAASSKEVTGAFNRISALDNEYEIGEEPEETWGWGGGWKKGRRRSAGKRRKRGSPSFSGWLSKRKKLNEMITSCHRLLNKASSSAGEESVSSTQESCDAVSCEKLGEDPEWDSDGLDGDATIIEEDGDGACGDGGVGVGACGDSGDQGTVFVACPICGRVFPDYAVEVHASNCGIYGRMEHDQLAPIIID